MTIPGIEDREVEIEKVSLRSKTSLLDYDIAIIDPSIFEFYGYEDKKHRGKFSLNDTKSFFLREQLEYWRNEILEALNAGKSIFLFLNEEETVFIATGEEHYSGTGRNRQTTRIVNLISNYHIIPAKITVQNSNGSLMKIAEKGYEIASYWNDLGDVSEFRVLLEGKFTKPIIKTKAGNKIVGARIKCRNGEGNLFLLPYINFDDPKYDTEVEGEMCWTEEALTLGQKIIRNLCSIDETVRIADNLTPPPDWASQNKYLLPKEEKTITKLSAIGNEIEQLQRQKEQYEQNRIDESVLKRLLYEKGKPLEDAVHSALKLIDFTVSHYEDADSEFDVIFESAEGRLLGEVQGRDNNAISIEKFDQLVRNINEDFYRKDISEKAKGVLIGNAYRLTDPDKRGDFFTKKCVTDARKFEVALIRSDHLFEVAKYLSNKSDKRYATACRKAILNTIGQVKFPDLPSSKPKKQ